MEPWKCVALLAPPVQTTQLETHFDVIELRHACENIIRVLSKQSPLHREGALISRFVYKYDKKFRNDIGYRMLKKNYSTLHKYLQVNLLKDVENFTAILPNEDDNFIPTRQMLQYLLLRIITFSKLMLKMYVCSKQAAVFYMDRVKRGESHWMSLMPYALLSRIWSMSAILLQHATSWYSCLYTFLPLLQLKGLKFLPGDYQLPKDLGEWLDLKNLDTFGKLDWSKRKSTTSLDLLENEEDDIFGNILEYANNINEENVSQFENYSITEESKVDTKSKYQQVQLPHVTIIDHGQAISRDSFESLYSTPIQNIKNENVTTMPSDINVDQVQTVSQKSCQMLTNFQKKITNESKGSHYFGKVTNAKSLNDFLDREEIFRNDGNSHSLTKHLSFMQWHSLRTSLLKVCKSVLNNRKIERKLQKVWKEKCLDYL